MNIVLSFILLLLPLLIPEDSFCEGLGNFKITLSGSNSQVFYDRTVSSGESSISMTPKERTYFYHVFCPSQELVSTKTLSDTIEVQEKEKGTYVVKAKLVSIVGFDEEEQSRTIPGSYVLEMCQVYTPEIMTKENTWEFSTEGASVNFRKTLNGKTISIKHE